jgi:hypothetical protein
MYQITICRSIGTQGSVIVSETLAVLHREEVPDNIDLLVMELGGDYYDVSEEEYDDED